MSHTTTSVGRTDSVSYEEREFYRCPAWCVRTDHPADVVSNEHPAIHYGPEYGVFWPQGTNDEQVYVVVGAETTDVSDPDVLRQIAADAIGAAEWLEARQSEVTAR